MSEPSTAVRRAKGPVTRARLLCLWLAFLAGFGSYPGRAEDPRLEFKVKAALLPKLAAFVQWPASAFARPNDPLRLAILGTFPFGDDFEAALKGQTANGRPFVLVRVTDTAQLTNCHILFIGAVDAERMADALRAVTGKPVLTIGDRPDFAASGGIINFIKAGGKVRFEINLAGATHSGLKISAKLLQVSHVISSSASQPGSAYGSLLRPHGSDFAPLQFRSDDPFRLAQYVSHTKYFD